jgi:hypothetical protein
MLEEKEKKYCRCLDCLMWLKGLKEARCKVIQTPRDSLPSAVFPPLYLNKINLVNRFIKLLPVSGHILRIFKSLETQ